MVEEINHRQDEIIEEFALLDGDTEATTFLPHGARAKASFAG